MNDNVNDYIVHQDEHGQNFALFSKQEWNFLIDLARQFDWSGQIFEAPRAEDIYIVFGEDSRGFAATLENLVPYLGVYASNKIDPNDLDGFIDEVPRLVAMARRGWFLVSSSLAPTSNRTNKASRRPPVQWQKRF